MDSFVFDEERKKLLRQQTLKYFSLQIPLRGRNGKISPKSRAYLTL